LGDSYIDVKKVLYKGSITLSPYASAVLIKISPGNFPPSANAGQD